MFKRIAICIAMAFAVFSIAPTPAAKAVNSNPAVFVIPHQDDELLTFGSAIQAHVAAGRDVWVVLVYDGQKSGVRGILSRKYGISLTPEQFGAARDREFADSVALLGVPADHVIYKHLPEGELTVTQVRGVFDDLIVRFGKNASYATMSWLDVHPDHRILGNVLNNMSVYGQVTDARFYQFQRYWGKAPTPAWGYYQTPDRGAILKDSENYHHWDPANGRYSVGMLSVPLDFVRLINEPKSKWHKDNRYWNSTAYYNAAKAWIAKCYPTPTPYDCMAH